MFRPKVPSGRATYVLGGLWLAAIIFICVSALIQAASP